MKVIVTAAGYCLVGGYAAVTVGSDKVSSNGALFAIGCGSAEALGWWKTVVDAFPTPIHIVHPGGVSANG